MISFGVHLLIVFLVGQNVQQLSDFGVALQTSYKEFPLDDISAYYTTFSNWAIYPLYIKLIRFIFGNSMFTCLIANALIYAISSVLIFVLCHLWRNSDKIGYVAAILYSFWPSHSLYIVILTPEFPNICLTLLSLVLLGYGFRNERIYHILIILSAMLLSLLGSLREQTKLY